MDYQLVSTSSDLKPLGFSKIIDLRRAGKEHCAIVSLVQLNFSTKENSLSNLHCTINMRSRAGLLTVAYRERKHYKR